MGCTRPGSIAVCCALIAGLLNLSSVLLPYWSEITVVGSTSASLDEEIASNLEVTFGIWGTCVMIQNRTVSSFLLQTATSSFMSSEGAEATLTCASFFQEGVVGIHCEAAHGFSDGKCSRSERSAISSLCAADKPVDMLLLAWDEDQDRGTVHTSATEREEVEDWLNQFLPDMCGAPGQSTVALAALSTACSGFAILLIVFGVVFDNLQSRIVHGGAMTTLIASGLQAALIAVWMFETHVLHHEGNHFGISFYLGIVSVAGHLVTYVVAMRHLQIEKDAAVELGLLEDDEESIDDIFKTRKLADDWDDDKVLSPRKVDTPRQGEVVV